METASDLKRFLLTLVLIPVVMAAPFSTRATRPSNPYPNELPGFKFYVKYLYPLHPLYSVHAQVVTVLGSDQRVEAGRWWMLPTFLVESLALFATHLRQPSRHGGSRHSHGAGTLRPQNHRNDGAIQPPCSRAQSCRRRAVGRPYRAANRHHYRHRGYSAARCFGGHIAVRLLIV